MLLFSFCSCPYLEETKERQRLDTNEHVILCLSLVVMLMYLTPDMAVELVSYHVEQCHHRHVKKEEAHQASSAEVPKKGIHPNSN